MEETPLQEIIRESDFVPILDNNVQPFLRIYHILREKDSDGISKKCLSHLLEETHELESFLDDYNARNNRAYSAFTEIVASIRNLTAVAYTIRHMLIRYFKYHLFDDVAQVADFQRWARDALTFCTASIKALFDDAYREAEALGVRDEGAPADERWFTDRVPKRALPHNVDEGVVSDEDQRVAELAAKLVRSADAVARIPEPPPDDADYETKRDYVARYLTEELSRSREAQVHSIQSKYDTYVKNTGVEARHEELRSLRGHVSMALHLLEATTELVHFYERHENDIRFEDTKLRIALLVDKRTLFRITLRAFRLVRHYLEKGRPIAESIVKQYTRVVRADLDLPEGLSLHARPASLIVAIVNHHSTPVTMEIGESRCDANSIIQVLMLAGQNSKARRVAFLGDEKPIRDLKLLFDARLGEGGLERLPADLDYLRHFGV